MVSIAKKQFGKVTIPYPTIYTMGEFYLKTNKNGTYICYMCNKIFSIEENTYSIVDFSVCKKCFFEFRKKFEEKYA